jgi:AAA family ATP:ADP antiporter
LIGFEYAIIRPVSNALFISTYGASYFPYAWLAAVPLNLGAVSLYTRYLAKWGCWRVFLLTASCVAAGDLFFGAFLDRLPALPFIHYVWKEVYVLLMYQQLWSLIHSLMKMEKAKYLYGIMFGVGGAGGGLGSLIPGFLAVKMGSAPLLFIGVPVYALLALLFAWTLRHAQTVAPVRAPPSTEAPLRLIRKSPHLTFILFIVLFMQIAVTVVDYQFNTVLQASVPSTDLRTEYVGRVMGLGSVLTMSLQFAGSFLLVHFLGLKRGLVTVPLLLGVNTLSFLLRPSLGTVSASFVTTKALDFSFFLVLKEMLYIPLTPQEKFQAKALIDVTVYRASKALTSCFILAFQWWGGAQTPQYLSGGLIAITLLWGVLALRFKPLTQTAPSQ